MVDIMKHNIIVVVLAVVLSACDVIEGDPREDFVAPPPDTTSTRNVLLEDFTGQLCGNCPAAAEEAKRLEEQYGPDRLIVMAIHVGSLAAPSPPKYPREFRSSTGNDIDNLFRVSPVGIPQGMINRVERNGRRVFTRGQWATIVQEQFRTKPIVELEATATYDSASRQIVIDASVLYKQRGSADHRIVAMLVENGIIGYQKDYRRTPSDVENSRFDHLLRTSLTSTWGESLSDYDVPANERVRRVIRYTVPADVDWIIENCDIIVYVHRHNSTREVLQVIKIKPRVQGS
jgi:thiol-disulfide isomerase/thioredoxin